MRIIVLCVLIGPVLLPYIMLGISVWHLKDVGRSMVAWLRKQAVTMIPVPFYIFFSSPGTPYYLQYMRIWQGSTFSSPVFLSHHLFGCARIHWNVFTRCQNSGNSTLFGSKDREMIK
jgi:hypothetical protein